MYMHLQILQAVQAPESSEKAGFVSSPPNL